METSTLSASRLEKLPFPDPCQGIFESVGPAARRNIARTGNMDFQSRLIDAIQGDGAGPAEGKFAEFAPRQGYLQAFAGAAHAAIQADAAIVNPDMRPAEPRHPEPQPCRPLRAGSALTGKSNVTRSPPVQSRPRSPLRPAREAFATIHAPIVESEIPVPIAQFRTAHQRRACQCSTAPITRPQTATKASFFDIASSYSVTFGSDGNAARL